MPEVGLLLVTILAVVVACFAAIAARALRDFSSHELQAICEKHKQPELFGEILRHRESVAIALEIVRVIATGVAAATSMLAAWSTWGPNGDANWLKLAGAGAALGLSLLAGIIWVPNAIVMLWTEWFLFYTWHLWRSIAYVITPLVYVGWFVNWVLHKLAGRKPEETNEESVEEEIRSIVTEGHHEGYLEDEAREMIEGVIELGDSQTAEIMTPRTDVIALAADTTWDDAVRFVVEAGHTRIPVYSKSRDEITGMLYIKDLLAELAKGPNEGRSLAQILRKPYFVPETKPVIELLQEFQKTRNHIAVVVNEFGGLAGVVTIEDVLEEIVGEIADEYDEDLHDGIKQLSENTYEAHARLRIAEVNERLGLSLPEDQDFETIGGFVFHEMGRIPAVGEELARPDIRIRVVDATRRRIDRVVIELIGSEKAVGEASGQGSGTSSQ